jgi:hydroxymethylpyrimidine pyrophosphatase-like HAD family hydrolase
MPQRLAHAIAASLLDHGHRALLLKDRHAVGYDYLAVGSANLDPALQWWFQSLPVMVRYAGALQDDEHPHESVRVGAVARGKELGRIASELQDDLGKQVLIQCWSAVTASEATGSATHLLEAFNPEVNKWTMTQACCRHLGIDEEQVAAIGDEINDVELIRSAGLGVAMGNAAPPVRDAADRITGHHGQDGVAQAIDHILAGRW